MRAHVIENGIVINTIVVNSLDDFPNLIDAESGGTIGDLWDGESFSTPSKYSTVEEAKEQKLAELAAYRYARETAGITVNGALIRTDLESQAMINGAVAYVNLNPTALIDWKAANAWVQIDKNTVTAIGNLVGTHVQVCYSRERYHAEAIAALTTSEEIAAYDFATGWPE